MCQRVEVCNNCPEKRMAEEGQEKKRGVPCTVCPKDCCQLEIILGSSLGFLFIIISIPVGITVCIYLVSLPINCLLHLTAHPVQWIFHRKKKRMEDESWIISYSDIITSNYELHFQNLSLYSLSLSLCYLDPGRKGEC